MWAAIILILAFLGGCTPPGETGGSTSPMVGSWQIVSGGTPSFDFVITGDTCGERFANVISTSTGELAKQIPLPGTPDGYFPAVVTEDVVVFGDDSGVIQGFSPTGEILWEVNGEYHHDVVLAPAEGGSQTLYYLTDEVIEDVVLDVVVGVDVFTGTETYRWKSATSLPPPEGYAQARNAPVYPGSEGAVAWLHANAIALRSGRLMISSYEQRAIITLPPAGAEGNEGMWALLGGSPEKTTKSYTLGELALPLAWSVEPPFFGIQHSLRATEWGDLLLLDNEHARALLIEEENGGWRVSAEYASPPLPIPGQCLTQGTAGPTPGGGVLVGCRVGGALHEYSRSGELLWAATPPPCEDGVLPETARAFAAGPEWGP